MGSRQRGSPTSAGRTPHSPVPLLSQLSGHDKLPGWRLNQQGLLSPSWRLESKTQAYRAGEGWLVQPLGLREWGVGSRQQRSPRPGCPGLVPPKASLLGV